MKLNWPKYLAIDTETTGINFKDGDRPFIVSMCDQDGRTYFWCAVVNPFTREPKWLKSDLAAIRQVLKQYPLYIFHNCQFDVAALASIGIDLVDSWDKIHDTLLMAHVLDSSDRHNLKYLADKHLGYTTEDETKLQQEIVFYRRQAKKLKWSLHSSVKADSWIPRQLNPKSIVAETYAVCDAERTSLLFRFGQHALHEEKTLHIYDRHRKLFPIIHKLQQNGISIRPRKLQSEIKRYEALQQHHEKEAVALVPSRYKTEDDRTINLSSSQQLVPVLYDYFKLPAIKVTKTSISTDAGVLTILEEHAATLKNPKAHKFLTHLLTFKKCSTTLTYLNSYAELAVQNKLYTTFNQTGTKWTRMSSQNPNAQNVGKGKEIELDGERYIEYKLRDVFGPPEGYVWYALDVDQLQLRIFAVASNEKRMQQAFRDGFDFHTWMGCEIFGCQPNQLTKLQRRIAKNVNFGYIFGASEDKIDATSGVEGLSAKLNKMFPDAHRFAQKVRRQVCSTQLVHTLGGYPITADTYKQNWRNSGVCSIVQGTEGEIIKEAMMIAYDVLKQNKLTEAFIMQVHDELIFQLPKTYNARPILRSIRDGMVTAAAQVGVEIKVNCERITTSWSAGKEYKL